MPAYGPGYPSNNRQDAPVPPGLAIKGGLPDIPPARGSSSSGETKVYDRFSSRGASLPPGAGAGGRPLDARTQDVLAPRLSSGPYPPWSASHSEGTLKKTAPQAQPKSPAPAKRSFFGLKSSSSSPKASSGPPPPPPHDYRSSGPPPRSKSVVQPIKKPTTHTRSASGGELNQSTPSRSSSGVANARLWTSVNNLAAANRPNRAPPPTREHPRDPSSSSGDEWVVLEKQVQARGNSFEPVTPPATRRQQQSYASPPFYPATPPTSDRGHGSLEGGRGLLGMGSLGDAIDWQWREGLLGEAKAAPMSYGDVTKDVVGMPPWMAPMSNLITPPRVRESQVVVVGENERRAAALESPTGQRGPPPRRDSLQGEQKREPRGAFQTAPSGTAAATVPRDRLPTRRVSLQHFSRPDHSTANSPAPFDAAAALSSAATLRPAANLAASTGYSPFSAFYNGSPSPSISSSGSRTPQGSFDGRPSSFETPGEKSRQVNDAEILESPLPPRPSEEATPSDNVFASPSTNGLPGPEQSASLRPRPTLRGPRAPSPAPAVLPPPRRSSKEVPMANRPAPTPPASTSSSSSNRSCGSSAEAPTRRSHAPVDSAREEYDPTSPRREASREQDPDPGVFNNRAYVTSSTGFTTADLPSAADLPRSFPSQPLPPVESRPPPSDPRRQSRDAGMRTAAVLRQQVLVVEQEKAEMASRAHRESLKAAARRESLKATPPSTSMVAIETREPLAETRNLNAARSSASRATDAATELEVEPAADQDSTSYHQDDTCSNGGSFEHGSAEYSMSDERSTRDEVVQDEVAAAPEPEPEPLPKPRFEFAVTVFPNTVLVFLLYNLSYADFRALRVVSKTLRRAFDGSAREIVMQRYLGPVGYRSLPGAGVAERPISSRRQASANGDRSSSRQSAVLSRRELSERGVITLQASSKLGEAIVLEFQDLNAFWAGLQLSVRDYALFAKEHAKSPLPVETLRLIRSATRAWNRVVLRIRAQALVGLSKDPQRPIYHFPRLPPTTPLYKSGRAPTLRVWVPTLTGWMNDSEIVECEREVWRAGVWTHTLRGDVVHNVAVGDFGNEGKLISDGKYLRDFQFTYDLIGHLPSWLDMLVVSPQFFHNVIASSTSNPVFYLGLSPFASQVREKLILCDDKVTISSPQGNYTVKRFVYRSILNIKMGTILGNRGGAGGAGPGGLEVVHDDWAGTLVVETDGTTENAAALLARCASEEPTPFRILREKSRPGSLWLRPVLDNERVN